MQHQYGRQVVARGRTMSRTNNAAGPRPGLPRPVRQSSPITFTRGDGYTIEIRCPRRGGPCQGRLAHSAIRQDEILPSRITHCNAGGGNEKGGAGRMTTRRGNGDTTPANPEKAEVVSPSRVATFSRRGPARAGPIVRDGRGRGGSGTGESLSPRPSSLSWPPPSATRQPSD